MCRLTDCSSKRGKGHSGTSLSEAGLNGHHSGNIRIVGEGVNEVIQAEIQFVDVSIHQLFGHRGGFEYARDIMASRGIL